MFQNHPVVVRILLDSYTTATEGCLGAGLLTPLASSTILSDGQKELSLWLSHVTVAIPLQFSSVR